MNRRGFLGALVAAPIAALAAVRAPRVFKLRAVKTYDVVDWRWMRGDQPVAIALANGEAGDVVPVDFGLSFEVSDVLRMDKP